MTLSKQNCNPCKTYQYHSNGRGMVPACHKLWASKVHQIGGKSPSSNSSSRSAHMIVNAAFHTYGCCRRTQYDHINHAAALVSPVEQHGRQKWQNLLIYSACSLWPSNTAHFLWIYGIVALYKFKYYYYYYYYKDLVVLTVKCWCVQSAM